MNAAPFRTLMLGSVNTAGVETGVTTGTSEAKDCSAYPRLTAYLRGVDTINAGTVILEEACFDPGVPYYSGTWSLIYTFTASTVSGGAQQAYHFPSPTPYKMVRARIGTTVSGGSAPKVTLVLIGN
jgi:hypothetical protein